MGLLNETDYQRGLLLPAEQQPNEQIAVLDNVRKTKAHCVELDEGGVARYGAREVSIEFGGWGRALPECVLGRVHRWTRHECRFAVRGSRPRRGPIAIAEHSTLIAAEVPFAGRRRYERMVFRKALHDQRKPHFGKPFVEAVCALREQQTSDIAQQALRLLEDPKVVERDPFTTGKSLIAAYSVPAPPFFEPEHDYTPRYREDEPRTAWALGAATNAAQVHRALEQGLIVSIEGEHHTLRPPPGVKRERIELDEYLRGLALQFAPHAAWLAMAGLGPNEPMPEGRQVLPVARWRLDDLLYNADRKRKRYQAKYGAAPCSHGDLGAEPKDVGYPGQDEGDNH